MAALDRWVHELAWASRRDKPRTIALQAVDHWWDRQQMPRSPQRSQQIPGTNKCNGALCVQSFGTISSYWGEEYAFHLGLSPQVAPISGRRPRERGQQRGFWF